MGPKMYAYYFLEKKYLNRRFLIDKDLFFMAGPDPHYLKVILQKHSCTPFKTKVDRN